MIGIDDYANGIPRLTTAANDARRLAQLLQADYGYEVCLLVEGVTKARLSALFQEQLPAQVGKDDRLLLYFAGHGIALDGDDGPEGFLIPQDAPRRSRHLSGHDRPARMADRPAVPPPAGDPRLLLCRRLPLVHAPAATAPAATLYKERYDRFIRDPAWQVITSAAYDQEALDILAGDLVGKRGEQPRGVARIRPLPLPLCCACGGRATSCPRAATA